MVRESVEKRREGKHEEGSLRQEAWKRDNREWRRPSQNNSTDEKHTRQASNLSSDHQISQSLNEMLSQARKRAHNPRDIYGDIYTYTRKDFTHTSTKIYTYTYTHIHVHSIHGDLPRNPHHPKSRISDIEKT